MRTIAIRRPFLGQNEAGRIIVVDANDRPVSGAIVSINNLTRQYETSGFGIVNLTEIPSDLVQIKVQKDEYSVQVTKNASDLAAGAYIKIPVCLSQPFVTTVEIGAFVVGIGFAAAGMYWKNQPAQVVGEVLVGAAAFTAIYRHSCL